ncbi:MAG: hypothetical protein MHM6MM_001761 [Cercozoa sp. M6MM]
MSAVNARAVTRALSGLGRRGLAARERYQGSHRPKKKYTPDKIGKLQVTGAKETLMPPILEGYDLSKEIDVEKKPSMEQKSYTSSGRAFTAAFVPQAEFQKQVAKLSEEREQAELDELIPQKHQTMADQAMRKHLENKRFWRRFYPRSKPLEEEVTDMRHRLKDDSESATFEKQAVLYKDPRAPVVFDRRTHTWMYTRMPVLKFGTQMAIYHMYKWEPNNWSVERLSRTFGLQKRMVEAIIEDGHEIDNLTRQGVELDLSIQFMVERARGANDINPQKVYPLQGYDWETGKSHMQPNRADVHGILRRYSEKLDVRRASRSTLRRKDLVALWHAPKWGPGSGKCIPGIPATSPMRHDVAIVDLSKSNPRDGPHVRVRDRCGLMRHATVTELLPLRREMESMGGIVGRKPYADRALTFRKRNRTGA